MEGFYAQQLLYPCDSFQIPLLGSKPRPFRPAWCTAAPETNDPGIVVDVNNNMVRFWIAPNQTMMVDFTHSILNLRCPFPPRCAGKADDKDHKTAIPEV
ncbi:hypothetical protein VTG60DRAFT_4089 [Thermothelomyces hinnuleus]